MTTPQIKSIRDLPPLERGGVEARQGFEFQDHVAARLLIEMLERTDLLEVWCETHDDITLFWEGDDGEEVEFVQVKALTLEQLWSVAKLTEQKRKDKKTVAGTSILERSLANDRGSEPSRFRLTTTLPPNADLAFLQLRYDAPDRQKKLADSKVLVADLEKRTSFYRSGNGNGVRYWLENTGWEVHQSESSLESANKLKLSRVAFALGYHVLPDQLDELYAGLLALARKAAVADWGETPSSKRITTSSLTAWLEKQLDTRLKPASQAGVKLKSKLQDANIPAPDIEASLELRHRYLAERYTPKYLTTSRLTEVESEVGATLHSLRAKLDSGDLEDDGVKFHCLCLTAVEKLQMTISETPPLSVLQGCMYNITDRCVHRFRRATA